MQFASDERNPRVVLVSSSLPLAQMLAAAVRVDVLFLLLDFNGSMNVK